MTKEEARLRRKAIAQAVRNGMGSKEACLKFNVSMSTVHSACCEHSVRIPRRPKPMQPRALEILRELWDRHRPINIARRHRVTIGYVVNLRKAAIEAGWKELSQH